MGEGGEAAGPPADDGGTPAPSGEEGTVDAAVADPFLCRAKRHDLTQQVCHEFWHPASSKFAYAFRPPTQPVAPTRPKPRWVEIRCHECVADKVEEKAQINKFWIESTYCLVCPPEQPEPGGA